MTVLEKSGCHEEIAEFTTIKVEGCGYPKATPQTS